MKTGIDPRRTGAALVATLAALGTSGALAGEIADRAQRAEQLIGEALAGGDEADETLASKALAELDGVVDAFWREMPLRFRTAIFAEAGSVKAFGKYQPRQNAFSSGETVTIYVEPVGYGFFVTGAKFDIDLAAGVEIRSPGGIVFAEAPEFGRLEWTGRARSREVHGSISVSLPELKPGDYEIVVTLIDEATGKTARAELPLILGN